MALSSAVSRISDPARYWLKTANFSCGIRPSVFNATVENDPIENFASMTVCVMKLECGIEPGGQKCVDESSRCIYRA